MEADSLSPIGEIVAGKTVALVGNASSLLQQDRADEIDSHEFIIRMNMGVPVVIAPEKIGWRCDLWATAKRFPSVPRDIFRAILFMKMTRLGDREWEAFQSERLAIPLVRWTHDLEAEVRDFVGADPGTGIRMLYWLKRKASPRSVSVYGMDCWETRTHWSARFQTPNHNPELERIAMEKLLA